LKCFEKGRFGEILIFDFRFLISGNDGAEILRAVFDHSFHFICGGAIRESAHFELFEETVKTVASGCGRAAYLASPKVFGVKSEALMRAALKSACVDF
jgi:hypothetical protein